MANPSGAKGARYESYVGNRYLARIFPHWYRLQKQGPKDVADFGGVGNMFIEAKWRKTTRGWRVAQWVREIMRKVDVYGSGDNDWVIFVGADKRSNEGLGIDVAVMPAELATSLLRTARKEA